MNLAWVRYQYGTAHKYVLMLLIGEDDHQYIGIISPSFTLNEANFVLSSLELIDKMSVAGRVAWMKENVNDAYKRGMRTIRKDRSIIVRRFPLKRREQITGQPS